ncbi:MAG: hypothetical protein AAB393_11830 [Bacteroidota bacterium]
MKRHRKLIAVVPLLLLAIGAWIVVTSAQTPEGTSIKVTRTLTTKWSSDGKSSVDWVVTIKCGSKKPEVIPMHYYIAKYYDPVQDAEKKGAKTTVSAQTTLERAGGTETLVDIITVTTTYIGKCY